MSLFNEIEGLLSDIQDLESRLQRGSDAWDEGGDPFAMADCDPSDQFLIGEEIKEKYTEIRDLINKTYPPEKP